jgi:two-component system, OmpR family, response regulator MprA
MTRVLIVDDEPAVRAALDRALRLDRYEIELAGDGREALDRLAETRHDAVVLDVMMPGIDGWEVCRQLKESPEVRHIPVIFLSARAQDEDRQRGYALGVDEYVTKPFDPAHLVEIVRRSLSKRSTQA